MRYKDIKLVEGPQSRGKEICAALELAKQRLTVNPSGLVAGIAAAKQHITRFPQDEPYIRKCLKLALGGDGDGEGDGDGVGPVVGPGKAAGGEGDGIANGIQGIGPGGDEKGTGQSDQPSTSDSDAAGNGTADNSGTTDGDEQGTSTKDSQQDVAVANALKASAAELERRLDAEDWQGAKDLIEGDPNLQAFVPSSLKTDLDAAIQATANAEEADRLAQEAEAARATADKKAAQNKADTEAQEEKRLADEAEGLAQEEQRLADEAKQKRKAVLQAEIDRAEAKRQSDAAEAKRLADAAEANRKAAKQLEADKEEAAKAAADAKTGSTPPTENPTTNQDSFDWEDL